MRRIIPLAMALVFVLPRTSSAQNPGLSGFLLRFFAPSNPVILADTGHAAHFGSQPGAQSTMTQLNRGIAAQLATFPLGSSSGGFAYTFDPELGVFSRSTESFGPIFAERALTIGKGKFSFGANASHQTFDSFEGESLRDGDITLFLTHADLNRDGGHLDFFFEGDTIRTNMFLDIQADTAAFFANYGVTDNFDVGLALPYLRIRMDARLHEHIEKFSTGDEPFVFHIFQNGTNDNDIVASDEAEGLGDVVLRAKWRFKGKEGGGLAAGSTSGCLPPTRRSSWLRGPRRQAVPDRVGERQEVLTSRQLRVHVLQGRLRRHRRAARRDQLHAGLRRRAPPSGHLRRGHHRAHVARLRPHREGGEGMGVHPRLQRPHPDDHHHRLRAAEREHERPGGSGGPEDQPLRRLLLSGNVLVSQGKRGLQDYVTPVVSVDYTF
jgi:hypothetical protein